MALIVSGDALNEGMKEPLNKELMNIAEYCEAVICCRVSPKQKAEVVSLVRKTVNIPHSSLFLTFSYRNQRFQH